MTLPALRRSLRDLVDEYDAKRAAIPEAIAAYEASVAALDAACCIGGAYAGPALSGRAYASQQGMERLLTQSAWRHVYGALQIDRIASAQDKRRFEQAMASPPDFTVDNVLATFEGYIVGARHHILRGLAEVFCDLDPAYRSHSKVKVGVAGLPKRVILSSVGGYGSYGSDRLRDILNALAAYQGLPLVEWPELRALLDDGDTCLTAKALPPAYRDGPEIQIHARGVRLKRFANGNGHLFFEPGTLKDINRALAEFYGDVLPDVDERPAKRQASTAVSKDLQYYPTPKTVAERLVADLYIREGERVLEPSCGCGRILDALRAKGAKDLLGIEVDPGRAAEARTKGHSVQCANFLETVPTGDYDRVVMNPPFYGAHYARHVEHALRYLKPGGTLTAILPATARYDHGLLSGSWQDLPVGSFSESGTNVNTCILTIRTESARAAA